MIGQDFPPLTLVGFNDEVTECDRCGRTELRGTCRLVDDDGAEYRLGSTCATRVTGRRITRQDGLLRRLHWTGQCYNAYVAAKAALDAGDRTTAERHVLDALRHSYPTVTQRAQLLALVTAS